MGSGDYTRECLRAYLIAQMRLDECRPVRTALVVATATAGGMCWITLLWSRFVPRWLATAARGAWPALLVLAAIAWLMEQRIRRRRDAALAAMSALTMRDNIIEIPIARDGSPTTR